MQFICCHAVEKERTYKLFADCHRDSGEGQLLPAPLPVPIHNSRNHNLNKFLWNTVPEHIILKPGFKKGFLWLSFICIILISTLESYFNILRSIYFFTILTEFKINVETWIIIRFKFMHITRALKMQYPMSLFIISTSFLLRWVYPNNMKEFVFLNKVAQNLFNNMNVKSFI